MNDARIFDWKHNPVRTCDLPRIELITKVPATLHTPLMSGANAISGISIIGALLGANVAYEGGATAVSGILAFVAVVLAMINVVGGFAVTNRMLNMIAGKKRGGA